jgi:hypothetical protein
MVKITKVAIAPDAEFKTADWKNWVCGQENEGQSPPIDYTVKGKLAWPIEEGNTIHLHRTERNGIQSLGIFVSSKILQIASNERAKVVITRNSVYLCEEIADED